jgi:hypothetical protein
MLRIIAFSSRFIVTVLWENVERRGGCSWARVRGRGWPLLFSLLYHWLKRCALGCGRLRRQPETHEGRRRARRLGTGPAASGVRAAERCASLYVAVAMGLKTGGIAGGIA